MLNMQAKVMLPTLQSRWNNTLYMMETPQMLLTVTFSQGDLAHLHFGGVGRYEDVS